MAEGYNYLNPIRGFEIENQNYKIDYDRGINLPVGVRNESIDARGRLNKHGEIFNERQVSIEQGLGDYSHTEGYNTITEGQQDVPQAHGYASHVEGIKTNTGPNARGAHAEGTQTDAQGAGSHAEGYGTTASGNYSHAEGKGTTADGDYSHAEGQNTTVEFGCMCAHAEGYGTTASGNYSHAEGNGTTASSPCSHAEGNGTTANGLYAHAEGNNTTASYNCSHAEGSSTTAEGNSSHAEGNRTTASGSYSHAEGYNTTARDTGSHAEGRDTTASTYAHAEGNGTTAQGKCSHAEGQNTKAEGTGSHAEGVPTSNMLPGEEPNYTIARGTGAHAEGACCRAFGDASHAQGTNCEANGFASFASGAYTRTLHSYTSAIGYGLLTDANTPPGSLVIGTFNAPQSNVIFTIGGGNSNNVQLTPEEIQSCSDRAGDDPDLFNMYQTQLKDWIAAYENSSRSEGVGRKNIFTVLNNGKTYITHDLYVGANSNGNRHTVYADQFVAYSSAADYAEYFLWYDGNLNQEIRQQKFVSLVEDKIKIAEPGEDIIGIISTNPIVLGDGELITNKNEYEYAPVGFLGKLIVEDNGECQVGSRCSCGHGGIAIPGSDYRVIKRLDNNHILVLASFL